MVALHLSAGKNEVSVYRAGVGPLIDLHFDAINIIRALDLKSIGLWFYHLHSSHRFASYLLYMGGG
jgi:hypothetical protein